MIHGHMTRHIDLLAYFKWTEGQIPPHPPFVLNLKTLFNVVEDRFEKLLNFDVCVV